MLRKIAECSFEHYQLSLFKECIRSGMTIVDVGASIGLYTLVASRCAGEHGRVYALEPDPRSRAQLVINLARNTARNVRVIGQAAGQQRGHRSFYMGDQSTVSALYSQSREHRVVDKTRVMCTTIDDVIGLSSVDLVKVDTEGGEAEVLAGMTNTLAMNRGRLRLFIEIHPGPLAAIGVSTDEIVTILESSFSEVLVIHEESCSLRPASIEQLRERRTLYCY